MSNTDQFEAAFAGANLAGAVGLIVDRDGTRYARALGVKEAGGDAPMAEDTLFQIASMTKALVSVGAMQLVEQGLIALSDPVAKYIPEFAKLGVFVAGGGNVPFVSRPPSAPLRVIDLMRHTSGFTYSFQERSNIDAAYRKTDLAMWAKMIKETGIRME